MRAAWFANAVIMSAAGISGTLVVYSLAADVPLSYTFATRVVLVSLTSLLIVFLRAPVR